MSTVHPSFLDLDHMALGIASLETVAHARQCPQCSRYVAQVGMLEAQPGPPWLDALDPAEGAGRRRAHWRRLGLAVALAAGVLGFVGVRNIPTGVPEPTVTAKGDPVVVLYLRRNGQVRRLGEGDLLLPGDAIRLGVTARGFAEITVRDTDGPDGHVLYSGPLPDGPEGLLPTSWAVDEEGDAETLSIRLRPKDPRRDPWTLHLTFTKGRP